MRHIKWIIVSVAVAVVVLGTFIVIGHLGLPPLVSEELVTLEPNPGEAYSLPEDNMMLVDFGKTRGSPSVAGIFIYADPAGAYTYNLRTTLQHDESYRIESMRLTFRIPVDTGGKLALVTPEGGPWNDPRFVRDPADGSISFSVEHLGFLGTGSVGNEFVVQHFAQELGEEAAFSLHATFTLRNTGFLQLREYVVDTEIEVRLPAQSSADGSTAGDDATPQAETALREFFQAWTAKDEAAFAALLTKDHQIGSWTFADLDHVAFGTVVTAPDRIDPWLNGGDRGVTRDDVRCFRAPVTFYYKSGTSGSVESGQELPWMWFLVRGADGRWRVNDWGA